MRYVGIDLGADTCSASIMDEQGNIKKYLEFSNDMNGWKQLEKTMKKNVKIAMEACTAAYPIHDYLTEKGYPVYVGHPMGIKAITHSKSKTDKKDSEILANLLRLNYLPLSYIPTPEVMKAREILRARIKTGQEITRIKNKIHAFITKNGFRPRFKNVKDKFNKKGRKIMESIHFGDYRDCLLKTMQDQYDSLMRQRKYLEKEIAKISCTDGRVLLLMSIPGIDYYTGLVIINEIGDINRFNKAEKLCSYAGLVPSVWSSAKVTKIGRITKAGPHLLRWVLTVVGEKMIRFDNPMAEFFNRIQRRKKSKKVARVALARKILVMIYYMLKNNEPCRWRINRLTTRKIKKLQWACNGKVLKA